MKPALSLLAAALFVPALAFGAGTRDYQVTGPVLDVTPDAITVENAGGRNGAYGPSFFQWDMRLGYQLRLRGTSRVELFGECFNLTNRANFDNPSGDRRLATFLVVTALRPGGVPRTFQLGARFVF